jgi:hypothetical protein
VELKTVLGGDYGLDGVIIPEGIEVLGRSSGSVKEGLKMSLGDEVGEPAESPLEAVTLVENFKSHHHKACTYYCYYYYNYYYSFYASPSGHAVVYGIGSLSRRARRCCVTGDEIAILSSGRTHGMYLIYVEICHHPSDLRFFIAVRFTQIDGSLTEIQFANKFHILKRLLRISFCRSPLNLEGKKCNIYKMICRCLASFLTSYVCVHMVLHYNISRIPPGVYR